MRLAERYPVVETEQNNFRDAPKSNRSRKWGWWNIILPWRRNISDFKVPRKRGGTVGNRPPSVEAEWEKCCEVMKAWRNAILPWRRKGSDFEIRWKRDRTGPLCGGEMGDFSKKSRKRGGSMAQRMFSAMS